MSNHRRQLIPVVAAGVLQPPVEPKRSAQDLLAERRANVLEQMRETDPTARQLLQFHIDQIDRDLHERREAGGAGAIAEAFTAARAAVARLEAERDARELVAVDPSWSVAQHARSAS